MIEYTYSFTSHVSTHPIWSLENDASELYHVGYTRCLPHFIMYVYRLLMSVSTYFDLSHYRVKTVYESQTIEAYHGGRP